MAGMKRHLNLLPWRLIPVDLNIKLNKAIRMNVGVQDNDRVSSWKDHSVEDNDNGDRMWSDSRKFSKDHEGSQNAQNRLLNLQRKLSCEKQKEEKDHRPAKNDRRKQSPKSLPQNSRQRNEEKKTVAEIDHFAKNRAKPLEQSNNKQCKAQSRLEHVKNDRKTTVSVQDQQLKKNRNQEVPPTGAGSSPLRRSDKCGNGKKYYSSPPRAASSVSKSSTSSKVNKSSFERNLFKRSHTGDSSYDSHVKTRKMENETNLCNVLGSKNKRDWTSSSKDSNNQRLKVSGGDTKEPEEIMDWEPLTDEHLIAELKTVRNNLNHHEYNMDYFCEDMCVDMNIPPSDTVLYVVVDTNVLISNMVLIRRLLNEKIQDFKPVVIIPWQVLKELDYLKQSNPKRNKSVESNARRVSSFLLDYSFKIRCQSQKDSLANNVDFVVEIPDDSIIKCCLQIQSNGHNTVLLTNDRNLCLKCTATQIISVSGDGMLNIMDVKIPSRSIEYEIEKEPKDDNCVHSPFDIAYQFAGTVKEFLSLCIENGLRNRYQFLWKLFAKLGPTGSLDEVLTCARLQWPTITEIENCEDQVAKLRKIQNFFSSIKYNKSLNDNDMLGMVQLCKELITALPTIFQSLVDKMKSKLEQIKGAILDRKNLTMVWRITRAVSCFQLVEIAAKCHCKIHQDAHYENIDVSIEEKSVFENLPSINEVIVTLEAVISLLNRLNNTRCGETTANTTGVAEMHKCLVEFCSKIKPEYKELEVADLIEFNNDFTIRNNVMGALYVYEAYCNYLKEIRNNSPR